MVLFLAHLVPRSAAAFGCYPGDDGVEVGHFAGFAVEAVGCVEFKRRNGSGGNFNTATERKYWQGISLTSGRRRGPFW